MPIDDDLQASLVERKIQEAMAAGEFDDLPGAGKPIPDLDLTYDPSWWVRKWIRRERVRDAADALRRTIAREIPRIEAGLIEDAEARLTSLREAIDALNEHLPEADRLSLPG